MTVLTVRPQTRIYAKQVVQAFGQRDVGKLALTLQRMDNAVSTQSAANLEDLRLNCNGRTRDGYRYTSQSFLQLCQLLSNGLGAMLPDISGMLRKDVPQNEVNGAAALQIFNTVLELRAQRLLHLRVVRDSDQRLIEGFIGRKHKMLPNLELLQQTNAAVAALPERGLQLHGGLLLGRKLLLWYREAQPLGIVKVDDDDWPIYAGYYFCNSEITGTSVRTTLAVFTRHGVALAPWNKFGGRVTHRGQDFSKRCTKVFDTTLRRPVPRDELFAGFKALPTQLLGYGGLDAKAQNARSKALAKSLTELQCPTGLAAEIVQDTLNLGHSGKAPIPLWQTQSVYCHRTRFDMFCSAVRLARRLPPNERERVEQMAYQLLI